MRDVIVITGAGGFLGSRVVPVVRGASPRSRVIAVSRRVPARGQLGRGVESIVGDLRTAAVWRAMPDSVTHVIHLAAFIPWPRRPAATASVVRRNLDPVVRLLETTERWPDLRQVVYASSVSVYTPSADRLSESSPTDPPAPYGVAKLAGERLLELLARRNIAVTSLRFSSIYGPGQYPFTVLPLLAERARRGESLEVFHAGRVQDFVHVDDAARAVLLACRKQARGPINIGTGRPVSMAALARAVMLTFGGSARLVVRPSAGRGDPGLRLNVARARRLLGYRARVGIEAGLRRLARQTGLVRR